MPGDALMPHQGRDHLSATARVRRPSMDTAEAKDRRRMGYRIAASIPEGTRQADVANALGVTQSAVSEWVNGTRRMTVQQVAALADHLNVERGWLAWG
jgi:transcriptional regulator with XRE-family HTH domain